MIKISNEKWKVMNVLWDKEPQTITQITKALQENTGWS
ncbi:MAG: BlaI/MecI/CopY family transcriptional regulator [Lachnospiraceae bacterium]|nr:BlaI/MecI/CopY family transcriptional regulator [Lachnospiraceae bacterium]